MSRRKYSTLHSTSRCEECDAFRDVWLVLRSTDEEDVYDTMCECEDEASADAVVAALSFYAGVRTLV